MENLGPTVLAINCMVDRIIEGETIASIPHRSNIQNVALKPHLNPESCYSCARGSAFTLDTFPQHLSCFKTSVVDP
jgi:hypothetical protein